jgi:carboxyl-terminal processing protease
MKIKNLTQCLLVTVLLSIGNFVLPKIPIRKILSNSGQISMIITPMNQQQINWNKVREIYEPQSEKISNRQEFIQLLEKVLNELYNGHSSLNTNLNTSNRLIPSGSDLYVEKTGDKYIIKDLRKGFGADREV